MFTIMIGIISLVLMFAWLLVVVFGLFPVVLDWLYGENK